jgi:hypothetical protein
VARQGFVLGDAETCGRRIVPADAEMREHVTRSCPIRSFHGVEHLDAPPFLKGF